MWSHKCTHHSHTRVEDHEYDTWVDMDRWSLSNSWICLDNPFMLACVLHLVLYTSFVNHKPSKNIHLYILSFKIIEMITSWLQINSFKFKQMSVCISQILTETLLQLNFNMGEFIIPHSRCQMLNLKAAIHQLVYLLSLCVVWSVGAVWGPSPICRWHQCTRSTPGTAG